MKEEMKEERRVSSSDEIGKQTKFISMYPLNK
jgi:hypothetical protein